MLCIGLCNLSQAQDKATEKEWKKKLKDMDPMEFKAKMTELDTLRKQSERKEMEIDELKAKVSELAQANAAQNQKIDSLKALSHGKSSATNKSNVGLVTGRSTGASHNASANGVVFKVQIGAFKNKALEKYFNNNKNFSGDVDSDGTKKYTLGHFIEYWEADNFKRYLREMGVADAWIVAYKDGQRVDIKDVLEGVVK